MQNWQRDKDLIALQQLKDRIEIISCDIFDTLLFRKKGKPEDVFIALAERAKSEGILIKHIEFDEFVRLRVLAEKKARETSMNEKGTNEIDISQIYNQLSNVCISTKRMLELEIQLEKESTFINPIILTLLQDLKVQSKKVILLSDMYLRKKDIEEILTYHQVDLSLFDEIIVSSEYKCNKLQGKLYQVLLEKYPYIDKSNILHIGDNEQSDVKRAKENGIKAIYYDTRKCDESSFEYEYYRYGNILSEILSLRKMCIRLCSHIPHDDQFWFQFGAAIMGPLLTVFIEYCIDQAVEQEIEYICPLMREAVILEPLIRNTLKKRKISNIKVQSLFVSRRSTVVTQEEAKAKLREYILGQVEEDKKVMTLDIGYGATIQNAIEDVLPQIKFVHMVMMGSEETTSKVLRGMDIQGFICNMGIKADFMHFLWNPRMIEALMMDDRGTTLHYEYNDEGKVVPILQEVIKEWSNQKEKALCHEGIKAFQKWYHVLNFDEELNHVLYKQRYDMHKFITRVIEMPTLVEAQQLGKLYDEDQFRGVNTDCFCNKNKIKMAQEIGVGDFEKYYYANTKYEKLCNTWVQGIITQLEPNYYLKKYMDMPECRTYFGNYGQMLRLAEKIHADAIDKIYIYGAGEMGKALIKTLWNYKIEPLCAIDRNETLWGELLGNVQITNLESVLRHTSPQETYFAIASCAYIDEIAENIISKASILNKSVKIYSCSGEYSC